LIIKRRKEDRLIQLQPSLLLLFLTATIRHVIRFLYWSTLDWGIEFARLMAGSIPVYPIEVKVVYCPNKVVILWQSKCESQTVVSMVGVTEVWLSLKMNDISKLNKQVKRLTAWTKILTNKRNGTTPRRSSSPIGTCWVLWRVRKLLVFVLKRSILILKNSLLFPCKYSCLMA